MRSARRGTGSDIAGSRPYLPGDDIDTIDWTASARLSAARASDEFIVSERYADEAPRVVILVDRRPEMSLFPPSLPWLSKPEAVRTSALLIADSTMAARGLSGYLDFAEGEAFWRPPRSQHEEWRLEARRPFGAPQDTVTRSFRHLFDLRPSLPPGSVRVRHLGLPRPAEEEEWLHALERRWDLCPVVVQDPTWERSFPDISGSSVPVVPPRSGRLTYVRLSRREAAERRRRNEERWQSLTATFATLDLEPIVLATSNPGRILEAFTSWAENRKYWRGRR